MHSNHSLRIFFRLDLCSSVWFKHFKMEQCFWFFRFKSTECKLHYLDCMAMSTDLIFLPDTYIIPVWQCNCGDTMEILLQYDLIVVVISKTIGPIICFFEVGFKWFIVLDFCNSAALPAPFHAKQGLVRIILYPFEAEIPHEFALFCYTLALCGSSLELGHKT